MTADELRFRLKAPFPENQIEWRIQSSGLKKDGKPYGRVLAYVTNRAIQDRLDEVFGVGGWKNDFKSGPLGGVLCGISFKWNNEWITKWDGADNTAVEDIKGGLSSAMKRCATQLGISRFLYDIEDSWAIFTQNGKYSAKIENKYYKWNPPRLPAWATPQLNDISLMEKKFTELINKIPESKRKDWYSAWQAEKLPKGKLKILDDFQSFFDKGY